MALLPSTKSTFLLASLAVTFLLTCSSVRFVAAGDEDDGKLSAYEALEQYDFPRGLLPAGVTGYELNKKTGEFTAYLNGDCKFPVESYKLEYKSTISGVISKGKLRNLKGVRVYIILFWINIVEVTHDGDELDFSIGIASASFPLDNFAQIPQCGCGLVCDEDSKNDQLIASS